MRDALALTHTHDVAGGRVEAYRLTGRGVGVDLRRVAWPGCAPHWGMSPVATTGTVGGGSAAALTVACAERDAQHYERLRAGLAPC